MERRKEKTADAREIRDPMKGKKVLIVWRERTRLSERYRGKNVLSVNVAFGVLVVTRAKKFSISLPRLMFFCTDFGALGAPPLRSTGVPTDTVNISATLTPQIAFLIINVFRSAGFLLI